MKKNNTVKFDVTVLGTTLSWKCTQENVKRSPNQNLDSDYINKETYKASGCKYSVVKNFGENEFFILDRRNQIVGHAQTLRIALNFVEMLNRLDKNLYATMWEYKEPEEL